MLVYHLYLSRETALFPLTIEFAKINISMALILKAFPDIMPGFPPRLLF